MIILLRLLLLAGMIFLVWKAWRLLRPVQAAPAEEAFEPTVQCCVCHEHVAKVDASEHDGAFYCHKHTPDDSS